MQKLSNCDITSLNLPFSLVSKNTEFLRKKGQNHGNSQHLAKITVHTACKINREVMALTVLFH